MRYLIGLVCVVIGGGWAYAQSSQELPESAASAHNDSWVAQWISPSATIDTANVWMAFRKEWTINTLPTTPVTARIAVDSKYWLWVNDRLLVREGQLKRGPTPQDTYYDTVALAPYLTEGRNVLALLVQYFGKEGFSHHSSGQAGLLFEARTSELEMLSDRTWKAWVHPSFGNTAPPHPNFRLPESNVSFDARQGDLSFVRADFDDQELPYARERGTPLVSPWNQLVVRPIPHWKDSGLQDYASAPALPFVSTGDTIICSLPYNAQITPYFEIEAEAGQRIDVRTDHYRGGGPPNVRAEYVSRAGRQAYENFGWMNGHQVRYHFPKGVKVLNVQYRESGYDTEFVGHFYCNDTFYNQLWQKALRTLYVTMRDTYMDCPDRERAQWWGDAVLESGEAFYALDRTSDRLTRKGILELVNWQRTDSTLFSPVPAGNWNKELPGQMIASVGYYGFWNYYWHSGDLETLRHVYEPVKKYLSVWKLRPDGTVYVREGGWIWGDWGEQRDIPLLINTQYYLALRGFLRMAEVLEKPDDAEATRQKMRHFKEAFEQAFWQGDHYRSADYEGKTDDRSQGLAVVAGLADEDHYEAIFQVLQKAWHASPYMEKYVLEALFQMGYEHYALKRMKARFGTMVRHPTITTLWEGWGIGAEGYGGGTINHAWSGGGLTLLSQYVAGVSPTAAGYRHFRVKPQPGPLTHVRATVPSVRGLIRVELKTTPEYTLTVDVPDEATATVCLPAHYQRILLNGQVAATKKEGDYQTVNVASGSHLLSAQ